MNTIADAGTITGSVFNDHNANGIKDGTSDGALSGRTVFIDANLNGTREAGETSTVSDANGKFSFPGLQPGPYRIIAINPANWKTTTPKAGFLNVTVAAGQMIFAGSFGSVHLSTIAGTFFNDANGNGLLGSGEAGLSGQTLFLDTNNNGSLDAGETSVMTDGSVNFSFTDLIPGTYHVRAAMPSGFHPTVPASSRVASLCGQQQRRRLERCRTHCHCRLQRKLYADTHGGDLSHS